MLKQPLYSELPVPIHFRQKYFCVLGDTVSHNDTEDSDLCIIEEHTIQTQEFWEKFRKNKTGLRKTLLQLRIGKYIISTTEGSQGRLDRPPIKVSIRVEDRVTKHPFVTLILNGHRIR